MLTKFAQSDTRVIFPDVALRARTAAYNSARCDVWSLPTRAWQSSVDLQHVLLQLLHVAVATWRRKYCRQQKPEMLGAACLGNLETTCSGHNRILSRALRQLPKRFHKTTKWHPHNHGFSVSLKNGGNAKTSSRTPHSGHRSVLQSPAACKRGPVKMEPE